ncbi:unnamed protein product [Urochloa humidicola]
MDMRKHELWGQKSSLSRISELLGKKDKAMAELEQKLGRLCQESQKIAEDKEGEETRLFNLKVECRRFEEVRGDVKQQFISILAELHELI